MSIAITTEPNTGNLIASSISNANDFVVKVTISTGELPPKIKTIINFFKIGTATGIGSSVTLSHEYDSVAGLVYSFNVDPSGRVQAYFNSLDIFPALATYTSGALDLLGADYKLVATSWRATDTDDTYEEVAVATSSAITSVNASRDLTQTQDMVAFDQNETNPCRFFTDSPSTTIVDYASNVFLTVHDANACYRVRVQYYTAVGGSVAATRRFFTTGTTTGENDTGKIAVIGVGPVNIDATGTAGRFVTGAALPMEANDIVAYDVRVEDSGPTQVTETRTYYIQACNPTYRIHFANLLGGLDSLLVSRSRNETSSVTGTTYASAKTSNNTAQVSGVQVLQKTGIQGIAFKMEMLDENTRNWLRHLELSPAVRLEKDGAYISLIVTKAEFAPMDQLGETYSFDFEAEYSNRIEGLRN